MPLRRPSLSIIVVTDNMSVRADFAGQKRIHTYRRESNLPPVTGSIASRVESAILLGPKRLGKEVLVLTNHIWTQALTVPRGVSNGLDDDEIQEVLKYEAEAFSGIQAASSQLGFVEMATDSDDRAFWLTQAPNKEASEIGEVVSERSSKLIGICSPQCNPVTISGDQQWQRTEFWSDAVSIVNGNRGLQVGTTNADPKSDRWQTMLATSGLNHEQSTESLVESGVGVPTEYLTENVVRLDEINELNSWLVSWAAQSKNDTVPRITPKAKPVSQSTKLTGAIVLAALFLVGCVGHYLYVRSSINTMKAEIQKIDAPKAKKQKAEKSLQEANKKSKSLLADFSTAKTDNLQVKRLVESRNHLALVLKAISNFTNNEFMISEINSVNSGLSLSGESIAPDAATRLARLLKIELDSAGWDVQAPTQKGLNKMTNGGPWNFTIELLDVRTSAPTAEETANNSQIATKK